VLDERDLQRAAIIQTAQDDRHFMELRQLGRAPAALAGDDLEMTAQAVMWPHQDRLQDAVLLDRLRQRLQLFRSEAAARLIAPGMQKVDRHAALGPEIGRRLFAAEQRRQAAAEM